VPFAGRVLQLLSFLCVVSTAAGVSGATAAPEVLPENPPDEPLRGKFALKWSGLLVMNSVYSSRRMHPGAFAFFVGPYDVNYFTISPINTIAGFSIEGVTFETVKLSGAIQLSLRSPTPLLVTNVVSPQFYDVHLEARTERIRVYAGLFKSVLQMISPPTINAFPNGYIPGQLGFPRPQVRVDLRARTSATTHVIAELAAVAPTQTLDVGEGLLGGDAGFPDGFARLSFGGGETESKDEWQSAHAIGISGHLGRRRFATDAGFFERATWSLGADLEFVLPTRTRFLGRAWMGSLVGDLGGAVFQTVSPRTLAPIRARGFWVALGQRLSKRFRTHVGFGVDDPKNADLGPEERSMNQAAFANVFWDWSRIIGFGMEASHWKTNMVGLAPAGAWRGEVVAIIHY